MEQPTFNLILFFHTDFVCSLLWNTVSTLFFSAIQKLSMDGEVCRQTAGVAKGIPLSSTLAERFMHNKKKSIIKFRNSIFAGDKFTISSFSPMRNVLPRGQTLRFLLIPNVLSFKIIGENKNVYHFLTYH